MVDSVFRSPSGSGGLGGVTVMAVLLLAIGTFMAAFPLQSGRLDAWYKRIASRGILGDVQASARWSALVAPAFIALAVAIGWLSTPSPFGALTVAAATFGSATFMAAIMAFKIPQLRILVLVFGALAVVLLALTA